MNNTGVNATGQGMSILARLRSVIPERQLRFSELLRIAELQASRLLELSRVQDSLHGGSALVL